MKPILLFLILSGFTFSNINAQNTYVIQGQLTGVPDSVEINLIKWNGNTGRTIATDTIRNGKFYFSAEAGKRAFRTSLSTHNDPRSYGMCEIWITKDTTKVTGESLCLSSWSVESGLQQQQEENKFRQHTSKLYEEQHRLYQIRRKASKPEKKAIDKMVDSIYALILKAELEVIKQCPTSEVLLYKLESIASGFSYYPTLAVCRTDIEQQYQRLTSKQKKSLAGETIYTCLYPPKIVKTGDQMADGTLYDLKGKRHKLSDYKGKYLLLDFWSCGCGPCVMAAPEMAEVAEKYKDSLYVISISTDTDHKTWKGASDKITWINLSDRKGMRAGLAAKYRVTGIPHFAIIHPEGKILDSWEGYGTNVIKLKLKKFTPLGR